MKEEEEAVLCAVLLCAVYAVSPVFSSLTEYL